MKGTLDTRVAGDDHEENTSRSGARPAMPAENRRHITDVRTIRALANPVRYRILGHLMEHGPRTASECAEVVGATPSNCSYHLRELARYGLVERVAAAAADGRDRPWRPTATGHRFGPGDGEPADPATAFASRQLQHLGIDDDDRLAHAAIDGHDALDPAWQSAESIATYGLRVTPDELASLVAALDALIRPYIALTREHAPPDARAVRASVRALRLPGER
jgi:DNA-binding transcriptional ArsR family regulator